MTLLEEQLERFKNLEHTQNEDEFEEMCVIRKKDVYEGKDVDRALEIMEVLDTFYDKIKEDNTVYKNTEFIDTLKKVIYDQCNSGSCLSIISSICKYFHKVGIVVEELIQQDLI